MLAASLLRSAARTAANGFKRSSASRALSSVPGSEGFPPYILNAPATEVSQLGNGLRVASEGSHGETATVGVWIDAGSRFETAETNGVAHFLEHITFKGSAKRTQHQLEVEIENMGGHLNAYTSREQTVFYAQVFKNDVPRAMEILGDMLLNPALDPAAIDKERGTILREFEEVNGVTEEVIFDAMHESAFPDQPLGRTILGSADNIKSISRDHLRNYIDTHYTGQRMVVAGAGAVDHAQLTELANQHFGALPKSAPAGSGAPTNPPRFVGSEVRFRDDNMPVAHVAVAVESAGWASEHAFPLMVMQTLLGSWDRMTSSGKNMNSELAQASASGQLCHSFHTFNTCYKDTGLFGVYYVAEPKKAQDMAFTTMENLVRLCHNVSADEVGRAKSMLKANMLMSLDGTATTCEDIGRQMLTYGRRMSPAEVFARIDAVNVEAIHDTARVFINDKEPVVSSIGNVWEVPDYNWWRRHTYWLRY